MSGLLLPWLGWAVFSGMSPSQQAVNPNTIRSCTAYLGECRDLPAADLDPTVRLSHGVGRVAFVDEGGRLMQPTSEQLERFQALVYEERLAQVWSTAEFSTLPDGTERVTFPGGFLIHEVARRANICAEGLAP